MPGVINNKTTSGGHKIKLLRYGVGEFIVRIAKDDDT